MYQVGDKVSYPMHGAGTIIRIEQKEVLNETKEYYTIAIPVGEIEIAVPVDQAEELGMRPVMSTSDLEDVIETLQGKKTKMPENWNRRYRMNFDRLKTGDILEVASVVRNLKRLSREKNLSGGDRNMLSSAVNLLVSEWILVADLNQSEVEDKIDQFVFS